MELTTVGYQVPPEELLAGLVGVLPNFGYFSLDGLTVSRQALKRMGEWFRTDLRLHQDTEFLVRLAYHARLYPGSIDAPVALRGVHRGNRITGNTSGERSRLALWGCLDAWRSSVDLPLPISRTVQARHMHCRVVSTKGFFRRLLLLRSFHGRWWLLDRPGLRATYFDALLGPDSWASRAMQKLVWRLFNRRFLLLPRRPR